MEYPSRTSQELLDEISALKERIKQLEQLESKRTQSEKALLESEERYRSLADNIDFGINLIDRDFTIITTNVVSGKQFHKPARELVGKKCFEEFEKRQAVCEHCPGVTAMATGQAHQADTKGVRDDGSTFLARIHAFPLFYPDGTARGFNEVVEDITERKHVEDKLRQQEEKYRALFNNAKVALFRTGIHDGKLIEINKRYAEKAGYANIEDCMAEFNAASAWVDPHAREALVKVLQATGSVTDFEAEIVRKDGTHLWISFSATIFPEQGVIEGSIVDITARKRAEEEKRALEERLQRAEKMEALGLLAGGVAHDLNNVIGVIVGYAELISNAINESNPMKEFLLKIMDGGQRAAAIIQDLLTLTRRGIAHRKVINLNRLILDFDKSPEMEMLRSYHPAVQFRMELEPELLNMSASPVHLEKTLFNLVSNAGEAMPKGGLVTIKTANQYLDKPVYGYDSIREGDYVVLSVSDMGEGIPEQDLKRIFEPFYTKKILGRSGTGLGLAVVWGTVKDHQGYVDVQSEKGKGTTFTLYVPVTREDITTETTPVSMSEYMGKGESILVVDDVKEQRDLAVAMLEKLNYKVTNAASGEDAVEYLKEHTVDLLILDMIMEPGMDGLDTYKHVLKMHPRQKAIIVSGFSESDRVHSAQLLGAGEYVKKPYVQERLGMAVKKELARK